MGIPFIAAIMGSFMFAIVHIIVHLVLFGLCYRNTFKREIRIDEFLIKSDSWIYNAMRGISYLFILAFGYDFIGQYMKFYVFNVLFYLSVFMVVIMYTIWILSFLKRNDHVIGEC
ncbi:hypothetical protein [Paenibacillus qinlingensis]|uniref:DUF3796 domain-containing protein n=1 Tax=Paenibacillus qinlingensis TaxID=1837343 RepID=A0ABU1NYR0_9BACL|nr:hypothetical protein [Paenibacillus qinlingensis]MDR6552633.1 hypothetical protein [Paenibacillus qinlingensis]